MIAIRQRKYHNHNWLLAQVIQTYQVTEGLRGLNIVPNTTTPRYFVTAKHCAVGPEVRASISEEEMGNDNRRYSSFKSRKILVFATT